MNTKENDIEELFEIAIESADAGEHQKAIDHFKKVLEIDPDFFEAWHYLGTVYDEMGDYQEAVENMRKALELNKEYSDAWADIAFVYIRMENYSDALECMKIAAELESDNYEIWYDLGYINYELDNQEQAVECYNKALELTERTHIDSLYNLACSLSLLGKKKEAIAVLKEAIEIEPEIIKEIKDDEDFKDLKTEKDFEKLLE